jgi:hypothetical protein
MTAMSAMPGRIAIERKTLADWNGSIMCGREASRHRRAVGAVESHPNARFDLEQLDVDG